MVEETYTVKFTDNRATMYYGDNEISSFRLIGFPLHEDKSMIIDMLYYSAQYIEFVKHIDKVLSEDKIEDSDE